MPLTLLYSDDMAGYADDAAFRAAYPYDPPGDLSTSVSSQVQWSATNGPDGGPGIKRTLGLGIFGFDKFSLSPQGHLFRVKGRWQFNGTAGGGNEAGTVVSVWWAPATHRDDDFAGNLVTVSVTTTGQLTVVVKTTAGHANGGSNNYSEVFPGAITIGVPFDLQIDGRRSTLTESSPGVWAPADDGSITVSVDGVTLFSFSGPVWLNRSDLPEGTGYWNGVSLHGGQLGAFEIWHETDSSSGPPTYGNGDGGDPDECCCCEHTPGGSSAGGTPPSDPLAEEPPVWTTFCTGGGVPPSAADPVNSEAWSL